MRQPLHRFYIPLFPRLRVRPAEGLTQEQLEERSGFSQPHFSGLEPGLRNPTIVKTYEPGTVLGGDFRELLDSDDVRSP